MHRMPNLTRSIACALALGFALGACSKAGLEPLPIDELGKYDNKLALEGQYCTQSDRPTPFPVKILIVLDRSGSWQFTDPENAHFNAITEVIDRNIDLPNVLVSIVAFNAGMDITPFTADRQVIGDALTRAFASGQTDYQGALSTAVRLLEQDMLDAGIATRARTKYVILFISDGEPDPRCNAGCGNDPVCWGYCDTDPDVDPEDDLEPEDYEGLFIDLVACGDYNADWQIFQRIDQIVSLRDTYGVGELRMHTLFVYSPNVVIPPLCDGVPPYERAQAIVRMEKMAEHGDGTMRDYNSGEGVDFLHLDYGSIRRPWTLSNFIVYNTSVVPTDTGEGFLPDSDRDGLGDDEEFDVGTDRTLADTDGDGYGDFIEVRNRAAGFDPNNALAPAIPCDDAVDHGGRQDLDGDLLAGCEERYLETDFRLFDSDADRMPDGMEVRVGLNPLLRDDQLDMDLDSWPNREELVIGSNPALPDAERARKLGYRYRVDDAVAGPNGVQCHGFGVDGMKLAVTLAPEGAVSSRGLNFIYVYAIDAPEDLPQDVGEPRAACVRARYLGESLKDPPGGRLVLTPEDFHEPASLGPADCVGYAP